MQKPAEKAGFLNCAIIARINGTEGRTRTGTVLPPGDFESPASTNFATSARGASISPA